MNPQEQETCGCGKKGCLEQYASATGIVRIAEKLRKENGNTALPAGCTAKQVFDYAKEGDELAMHAVEELGRYLGLALASCACVLNPEGIVIGGGVSRAGKILLDVTEKNFQTYVFKPCRNVKFSLAELGNDAGIYGAAAMVN